jgi:hypothetical protein
MPAHGEVYSPGAVRLKTAGQSTRPALSKKGWRDKHRGNTMRISIFGLGYVAQSVPVACRHGAMK